MRDKVLIDTSVWISYFQTNAPARISNLVDEMLEKNEVCVPKIVFAELIQGAHSEKDLLTISEFLDAFTIIEEQDRTWEEAGKLSYALKKKGKTVNLADCYIAVLAKENDCSILTLDKHFREIHKQIGIKLVPV
jgi:predicted nucleic acid-binding protein